MVCNVCNEIKIQLGLHPDTLVNQSDSYRVDWFMW